MAKQKIFYECGYCKRLYDEEGQAKDCETHHAEMVHLKVIDCIDANADKYDLFPDKILLMNDQGKDHLAEYKMTRQGGIADFYQSEGQWHQS